jgi:signal transduction histidine kinase/CheY-like chemotaxis protein
VFGRRASEPDAIGPLRVLLVAAVAAPALLFAAASWINYYRAFEAAESELTQLSKVAREHADKIFDSHKLIADEANELVLNLDDDEIRRSERAIHERLLASIQELPQVSGIWVLDHTGHLLVAATVFPVNRDLYLADRDYFAPMRDGDERTYINQVNIGRSDGKPNFGLSRRRELPDHDFNGLVNVSADPNFLVDFYSTLVGGDDDTVDLVRADGEILARYPMTIWPMPKVPTASPFYRSIAQFPNIGLYRTAAAPDRIEKLVAYSKLDNYPVYVAVGRPIRAILATWKAEMASHLVFGIPATIALVLITLTALRRTRREQAAVAQLRSEMTRRLAAEGALRQAQKMEAVGQLTGGIAHDFNNILTIITGNLDLAHRLVAGQQPKVERMIGTALGAVDRAASLIRRLLAFARRQPLEPAVIDVNKLVAGMSELVRRMLGETISIETVLAGGIWSCFCDANQLESALLNLVLNARDAMPDGGALTVETQNTLLDDSYADAHEEVKAGQYVMVSISDTGTGMMPEIVAQVFEPFFTTKQAGEGSGLGLSMVYGFIKQSGGHIKIYSELGQGTAVKLYLPRHFGPEQPVQAPADRAELPKGSGDHTILVVEDDPDVRDYSVHVLTDLGYQVVEAPDGAKALALLRSGRPVDLLFTDVVLPAMNGRELARRAVELLPGLKVIFTTGYTRNAIIHSGRLDPDVVLVAKPFTPEILAKRIRAVLGDAGK